MTLHDADVNSLAVTSITGIKGIPSWIYFAVQSQKAVTAYFSSKQLLPFSFGLQSGIGGVDGGFVENPARFFWSTGTDWFLPGVIGFFERMNSRNVPLAPCSSYSTKAWRGGAAYNPVNLRRGRCRFDLNHAAWRLMDKQVNFVSFPSKVYRHLPAPCNFHAPSPAPRMELIASDSICRIQCIWGGHRGLSKTGMRAACPPRTQIAAMRMDGKKAAIVRQNNKLAPTLWELSPLFAENVCWSGRPVKPILTAWMERSNGISMSKLTSPALWKQPPQSYLHCQNRRKNGNNYMKKSRSNSIIIGNTTSARCGIRPNSKRQ